MRFLHLADLHIGKAVNGFSLLEDQRHILQQIIQQTTALQPDAVVIAGDVYDKAVPTTAAVTLLDDFLFALAETHIPVLLVAGNHDSPERLGFAGRIMQNSGVHVYSVFDGSVHRVPLQDAHGVVEFHLLPFIRPAQVRPFFPDMEIASYQDAVQAVLQTAADAPTAGTARRVLVAHQFVVAGSTGPLRSESETEPVGGLNSVDAAIFDAYQYVALGHLHGPQRMGRDGVRYAGSPLKYSFSEHRQNKALSLVELDAEGKVRLELVPLAPLRDMRVIRGTLAQLTDEAVVCQQNPQDYLRVVLTDEEEVLDAIGKLRRVYPHVMELAFDNTRSQADEELPQALPGSKAPEELFADFFEGQNGRPLSCAQQEIVSALLPHGEGGEK